MVARARKHNESFDKYRANLKQEERELKARLRGQMNFISIRYFMAALKKAFSRKVTQKESHTFNEGRNARKRTLPTKAQRKAMRRAQHRG